MIRTTISSLGIVLLGAAAFAADAPTIGQTLDGQFRNADREIVPLAEAMPADKYNFAPTNGDCRSAPRLASGRNAAVHPQIHDHLAVVVHIVVQHKSGRRDARAILGPPVGLPTASI